METTGQEALAALRRRVDTLDTTVRGDGNGNPGLAARVRTLEGDRQEVRTMLREWEGTKNQLRGAKTAIIAVGLIVSLLGGGLGLAILEALRRLAAGLH